jgi:hypothetical protein
MEQFADLVATAIANAEAGAEVERLAQEQAGLRRVATLVAREAPQADVFTAIAEAIGELLRTEEIRAGGGALPYAVARSAGTSGAGKARVRSYASAPTCLADVEGWLVQRSTHVSLAPPFCDALTMSAPSWRATRVTPPGITWVSSSAPRNT